MISCPDHKPKQHRDRRPAWCPNCGLTKDGKIPQVPQDPEVVTNPQTFPEPEGYDEWDEERPVERGYVRPSRTPPSE